MNPELFIHPSDRAAMSALKAIPGFTQVMKGLMTIWNEKQFKLLNMSSKLKLSERQMKKYHDMLPPICEKLGIDVPELYIELDVNPNAYTYGDTNPFIVLTSGLFETLPEELIPSVLAHECGHIACRHTLYSTMGRLILNSASLLITGLGSIALYPIQLAFAYWMRCSELSADRAAVYCDGGSDKVVGTMIRFAGYDKDIGAEANEAAFMEQAKEYREMVKGDAWNKTLEFIMFKSLDHPLNAVRALEAYEWAHGNRFDIIMRHTADPEGTPLPPMLNPKRLMGRNADDVRRELNELGYEQVSLVRTAESDGRTKENCVAAIAVDGKEDWSEDYYLLTSTIVLTYYQPKTADEIALEHPGEVRLTEALRVYISRPCDETAAAFADMGFENVRITDMAIPPIGFFIKPDTVARITLDGREQVEKDSWHMHDAAVVIWRYVKI